MKTQFRYFAVVLLSLLISCSKDDANEVNEGEADINEIYFPLSTSTTWETISIEDLNWNEQKVQPLLDYLEEKNSKSFIMLYNGKIVLEHYMNDHSSTKKWYWASAGKTLTTAIVGIAEADGLLNIDNKVSDYLNEGWTSSPLEKENLITCKNLLSMNSGLDDTTGEDVSPENLLYTSDAGTRWAYHNVYVKLQDVVAKVSNQTWNNYFNTNLRDKIGMSGSWLDLNDLSVYWSDTRGMARFGLLMAANGKWENTQILPESYLKDAVTSSQDINKAYGYLWWLNGKESYHLPSTQQEFNGPLIPNAPSDMYAALGKNDQKIYIVPSKKIVIVRMGEAAEDSNFALSNFDNDLWAKINDVIN